MEDSVLSLFHSPGSHTSSTQQVLAISMYISSFDIKKLIVILQHYLRLSVAMHVSTSSHLSICVHKYNWK